MRLEGFVQLKQVRMSQIVSDLDLSANHRPFNRRTCHELSRPASASCTLNGAVYDAKLASVDTRLHCYTSHRTRPIL